MDDILSVTQLTNYVKQLLQSDPNLKRVAVEGEISNYYRHDASGHIYFTLKDDRAKLQAVMFNRQVKKLDFKPEGGMEVVAEGPLTIYSPRGEYQIQVEDLQPGGEGALHIKFKQLKQKLEREGLFAEQYKQRIPEIPSRIGVVTSPTGAAIRDIISVVQRRFSNTSLLIAPATVQGDRAADSIIRGIELLHSYEVDVIIIGRGGGSLEDLWAFNEEKLARAVFNSRLPIISAVGHETDYTITDYVADERAPTPSAAAEKVVADRTELKRYLQRLQANLHQAIKNKLHRSQLRLAHLLDRRAFRLPQDLLAEYRQQIDELRQQLDQTADQYLTQQEEKLKNLSARLDSLSPLKILERGYSLTTLPETGEKVTSVEQVGLGEVVEVKVKDGSFTSQVAEIKHKERTND